MTKNTSFCTDFDNTCSAITLSSWDSVFGPIPLSIHSLKVWRECASEPWVSALKLTYCIYILDIDYVLKLTIDIIDYVTGIGNSSREQYSRVVTRMGHDNLCRPENACHRRDREPPLTTKIRSIHKEEVVARYRYMLITIPDNHYYHRQPS